MASVAWCGAGVGRLHRGSGFGKTGSSVGIEGGLRMPEQGHNSVKSIVMLVTSLVSDQKAYD